MIELLERVPIHLIALNLLHKCYDRNARFQRFGHGRHQQRGSRTILGSHHADLSGSSSVAIGHGAAHILLPVGDLANAYRFSSQDESGW
ncbi:hypothetical protein Rhsp01_49070 [Rhizobium sp. NBRC 114257]|uniref:Uncharacterized protein n=1 Tax=Rhizobium dioscoreae TaxID=2653122 RepID=A0ABQ0ZA27_9HYPH|nr:hypothetical protein RsS93_50200 [Rhizobium dioscoreae]GLU83731.1 hypothetical protein Rhsp01_49070 [Rhizobium sp. NBRC 114257]